MTFSSHHSNSELYIGQVDRDYFLLFVLTKIFIPFIHSHGVTINEKHTASLHFSQIIYLNCEYLLRYTMHRISQVHRLNVIYHFQYAIEYTHQLR